jgi:FKBP-type peptidyl-prolyl cis-trans isomerase
VPSCLCVHYFPGKRKAAKVGSLSFIMFGYQKITAMLRPALLMIAICFFIDLSAQTVIPAYTGYAVPADKDEYGMFSEKNGLHWTNASQTISYSFYLRKTGDLSIAIIAKNNMAGNTIKVAIAGKNFTATVPASKEYKTIKIGNVPVKDSGFYTITLTSIKKAGNTIADLQSINLSGTATENMHFNPKARRNAASVHLKYPLPDSVKAVSFYNEITIPAGADIVHSYYMACGFARGYFGIQVNSSTERRVIFSVWDAGKEAVDRNKVADSNKVQLLAKGENVFADGFGNEGTGGHSHWVYPWKTGETYKFWVTVLTDSATQTTIYTGYFFIPELQKWKLIASFKAPHDGQTLRNLYSFNENFVGLNGQLQRKAYFGNQWIQRPNGSWKELTQSTFSYDATGKAGDRIDYGGGEENGKFYLWNGGFQKANAKFGDVFTRTASNIRPMVDVTKNADSLAQAAKDKEEILSRVRNKEIDTTGSREGVYYHILKEGTGDFVSVNDTVTLYYKGWILQSGLIFDQTKDKPAVFPLKRLIRGWQIAVPMCKVGGKIRMYIPSGIAYSIRSRSKDIPPNSILVFDVEVLASKK